MAYFEALLPKHARAVSTLEFTVMAQNDLICNSARLLCLFGIARGIYLLNVNHMHSLADSSLEGLILQLM